MDNHNKGFTFQEVLEQRRQDWKKIELRDENYLRLFAQFQKADTKTKLEYLFYLATNNFLDVYNILDRLEWPGLDEAVENTTAEMNRRRQ